MKKRWEAPQLLELETRYTEQYNNSSGYDWYAEGHPLAGALLSLGSTKTEESTIVINPS